MDPFSAAAAFVPPENLLDLINFHKRHASNRKFGNLSKTMVSDDIRNSMEHEHLGSDLHRKRRFDSGTSSSRGETKRTRQLSPPHPFKDVWGDDQQSTTSSDNLKGSRPAPKPAGPSKITCWTEDMHRSMVEAIYEVGVKHASPSVIMESMNESHPAITSERLKSHLQKYRNNKDKSKQEFLDEYVRWMQKSLTVGAAGGAGTNLTNPASIVKIMGAETLVGGDVAAFLSYAAMYEEDEELNGATGDNTHQQIPMSVALRNGSNDFTKYLAGARIPFPVLTPEERRSPLGISLSHVISLFHSMTHYLMRERQVKALGETEFDNHVNQMSAPTTIDIPEKNLRSDELASNQLYLPTAMMHRDDQVQMFHNMGENHYSYQQLVNLQTAAATNTAFTRHSYHGADHDDHDHDRLKFSRGSVPKQGSRLAKSSDYYEQLR